jgi:general secretion pathway protein N
VGAALLSNHAAFGGSGTKVKLRRIITCLGVAGGVAMSTNVLPAAIASPSDGVAADGTPIMVRTPPNMMRATNEIDAQRESSGNPLWAVPLAKLTVTRERPLFSPSRRPPAPAVAAPPSVAPRVVAPPAPPERPLLALVGSVVGQTGSIAVFTDTTTNNAVRLKMGQDHAGWILRSIKGREATLQKDSQTAVLALPARDAVVPAATNTAGMPLLSGGPARIPQRRLP